MSWIWDDLLKIFRSVLGRFGLNRLLGLRDEFTDAVMADSDALTRQLLVDGSITIQQWTLDMRELLKNTYRAQYELGIGGRNMMTQADFGRLGGILRHQYTFLNQYAADLAAGRVSVAQALSRSRMYISSSTQAFERAKVASRGLQLPQYPGDGRTQCRANCKCHWKIVEGEFEWECTWKLAQAEHCPDCVSNAAVWNPLIVPKGLTTPLVFSAEAPTGNKTDGYFLEFSNYPDDWKLLTPHDN